MLFYNEKIFKRCFYHRGKYWYKNITKIPLYFKLIHHLIKHGYDEYATWETFNWFIDTMKPILFHYRDHNSVPMIDDYTEEESEEMWYGIVNRMIELLDLMDEGNVRYQLADYTWIYSEMNKAKDEFFELFSKYFYHLWD